MSICTNHQKNKLYVVCSVRMIIDTTEESCRRILANEFDKKMRAARMLVDEVRHIVNEARNKDERTLSRLLLDYLTC